MLKYYSIICLLITTLLANASLADKSNTTINIAFDLWLGYYPLIIAKHNGYFDNYQLNVNYTKFDNVADLQSQYINRQFDAICIALGDVFSLLSKRPNTRIVFIADISAGADALISLSTLPRDLRGLRIGTNTDGFGELFVEKFLQEFNLKTHDITLVNNEASQAKELLLNKQVDIIHAWEPHVSIAVKAGARILYTSRQTPGLISSVIAFDGDFLNEHSQASKNFIKAWLEASEWWLNNPIEGNEIIKEKLHLTDKISLKGIKLMSADDNKDAYNNVHSPRSLPRVVKRYGEFFYQKGILKQPLNPDDMIDGSFLLNNNE